MTDRTKGLITEARQNIKAAADSLPPKQRHIILKGESADDRLRLLVQLSDALEAEHERAETATATGERILADALRYRATIEEALRRAPGLLEAGHQKVDRMVGILARALNEGETDDR
ncbi:hypothetical protein [Streptomyces sp. AC495_CC817]|uniref:hypothetical protein n=1 Tax=Streptomyces sp. AC495_CC817 TaxID=2823900 RepID=UPI001C27E77D|nr:hypothetical protein [Streptomyces sp. AC495_CC817]